ncbi:Thiol-disulfide isomerase or thioredoxin [Tenacibaculum sp. MAR_2009_124]|uniref:TlpA family protein disulfide reductase n=1 Tax=Tenacibaculum sp. MAR_2009_124 TaxID=1250059 RepID=UPI000897E5C3|nr:redoxin domain-containing protein [Tenacibaculum sp. MAR_2009_124]SEC93118.1 Thiol-disulfide isomerase or thioredoxin [Tenacibaculum sp. MAR_2009_124]
MKKVVFLLIILFSIGLSAQEKVYYNFAVNNCEEETAEGLINNCLKGSYLLNYDFVTIDGKKISTDQVKTPIVLIAASTRCAPCWGDIPALNKMVEKYDGKVEFVMFFWDDLNGIQRMQKKLDPRIKLVPPTKKFDNKAYTESYGFVHKLDYPTTYLIGKDKKFISIRRGAAYPSKEMNWDKVNEINEKELEEFIKPVL